ncbi:PIG-L family deacetylase [Neptunomonas sp.]|uniref:PIG-L deacetylase family protein n=1 Tax=Neptunomonas sp. TaxID=1971898 RepID=UPI0025F5E616|nr:PIG-L family deacetylase [Neptunomonas sp.]
MNIEQFFTPYTSSTTLPAKSVIVLAPHPDDEVFGCAGTLNQLQASGTDIHVLILTDGVLIHEWADQPAEIATKKRHEKKLRRQKESIAAAAVLGYPLPQFLGFQDGQLLNEESLLPTLQKKIEDISPDLILAPSIWEMHRDHRAVAQVALKLLLKTPNSFQLAFYEIGVPLIPNYFVDITLSTNKKNKAMACFPSQLQDQAYADQIRGLNLFRSYTLGPKVQSAEAFHLLNHETASAFNQEHQPDIHTLALLNAENVLRKSLPIQLLENRKLLKQAEQEIKNIKNTLSWRITAPLRYVRKYFN